MNPSKEKILFLVPYPLNESPSQRFRFEQYFNLIKNEGYRYEVQSFLDSKNWQYFFMPGNQIRKVLALVKGFSKRLYILTQLPAYNRVFIHREVTPAGPPIFEWIIAKVFQKKIIYDFDDAIWLTDRKNESWFLRVAKSRSKVVSICSWSYKVSAGNEYLCNFAKQFARQVVYNPTTIDTDGLHNPANYSITKDPSKFVIGWTGSHSTLKYLKEIESELMHLEKKYPQVQLLVIADKRPAVAIKNLRFIPWSFDTEIKGLLEADIGIMPLPDDEWANGKCGFKALQYMALEIPAVASPVGVNTRIIEHGKNGFLCSSQHEWVSQLDELIANKDVREKTGRAGREKVINEYSVLSNQSNFLSLLS